ncbi:DUF4169 family protein [Nitratireductor luteus]|uniref:DUF4169 family protein n=1 Tax=Nitratireductor luteus TaxID=2976980 RepID=UPI002240DB45|nr:DUF4169 family protein [Nitratireductor luteus]
MGDIVNLRRKRKEKARADKRAIAEENRVRFGRTRAARDKERMESLLEAAKLDAHRRDPKE